MLPIRRYGQFFWLLPALLLLGCGISHPKTISVSGTVTYHKEPLKGAGILFISKAGKGSPAMGQTDANGRYSLHTFAANDGAMPGDYAVAITAQEEPAPGAAPSAAKPKSLIPDKYGSIITSGLTATVSRGQQEHNFDLD